MFVDDERPSSLNWRGLDEADKPHELHVSLMDQVVVRANMRGVQTARYCEGGFSVSTPILSLSLSRGDGTSAMIC